LVFRSGFQYRFSGRGKGVHRGSIRQFFQNHTIPACIFSLPELSNGFRRLIQPFPIRDQSNLISATGLRAPLRSPKPPLHLHLQSHRRNDGEGNFELADCKEIGLR
jgi:hypothetical protein